MPNIDRKGSFSTRHESAFYSLWEGIDIDRRRDLIYAYGSGRLVDLIDYFGLREPTATVEYVNWEADRLMPTVKVTTSGAGAGAQATFTVDSDSELNVSYDVDPYNVSGSDKDVFPVRKNDRLKLKPASGNANFGNLIEVIIDEVDIANNTFTATPISSSASIPAISSADYSMIFSDAHGEGSGQPDPMARTYQKYSMTTGIFKDTAKITDIGEAQRSEFNLGGKRYFSLEGLESDAVNILLNKTDLGLLIGDELDNGNVKSRFADSGDGEPVTLSKGIIPTIFDRGNTHTYGSVSGLTLADFENDIVPVLDTQKGSKENLFCVGLGLAIQNDRVMRDELSNGAISYGKFNMSQEKAINFQFKSFDIGGYKFHRKTIDTFNDANTLGLPGFGFRNEGMIIPMENSRGKDGTDVPPIRTRYLQKGGSESMEFMVDYFDGVKHGDEGKAIRELRLRSYKGIEMHGVNRCFYIQQDAS